MRQQASTATSQETTSPQRMSPIPLYVDTHVHFHSCFDPAKFFDHARRNFSANPRGNLDTPLRAALFLTESEGVFAFREFADQTAKGEGIGSWKVEKTQNANALRLTDETGNEILLVAGRQIVTQEDLEVLALGRDLEKADGSPIDAVLQEVHESGAVPVVPWGFGKWWGKRGEIVTRLVDSPPVPFFLGDNAGRLSGTPRPPLFAEAERKGIAVLPGTDPLPFPRHGQSAGRYGFSVETELTTLDPEDPAAWLRDLISHVPLPLETFGGRDGPIAFVRNQVGMQIKKRLGR